MTSLHIDNRERDLLSILTDVHLQTSNLELGDCIIKHNDITLLVIERKTWSDLAASIKDGRYHNQKKLLIKKYPINTIYYIIEGSEDYSDKEICMNGISKKILLSCIYNTMIRDNIKVFRTMSLFETSELIRGIYSRISDDPSKYMISDNQIIEEQIVKKIVKTPEEYFIRSLCQVPGVSLKTAKAIAEKYHTFPNFIKIVSESDQKLKLLKEITTKSTKGAVRKISDSVAQSLIDFIIGI